MNVLVACEFSGVVRDTFLKHGVNAVSCDLLPSESQYGVHLQCDVQTLDLSVYDLIIAHPPCTYLCNSGIRWIKERSLYTKQQQGKDFFMFFTTLPNKYVCIENPIGIMSTQYRKPDQIIQPYQYGHTESKATCLWLKNLPKLQPTCIMPYYSERVHKMSPSKDRWKNRSRTYIGIAYAMAEQWIPYITTGE